MVKVVEDLILYQKAISLANAIFPIVDNWGYFYQNTLGTQLVRAADSVPANISEGFGRFHYNESKLFYYYARGSLFETKTHLNLARQRGLIAIGLADELISSVEEILKTLNVFIKSIGQAQSL